VKSLGQLTLGEKCQCAFDAAILGLGNTALGKSTGRKQEEEPEEDTYT
jgi:hypothetical protein